MKILRTNNKYYFLIVVLISMFLTINFIFSPRASAAYEGGRLVDNSVFLDARSMSKTSIQNFLISKNSGLSRLSFPLTCYDSSSREWSLYVSAGAPCGQTIPAADIIYYATQVYGLNPKVILATLQKEQSLITSPNPTSWQINQAMGYGCPTTGSCSDSSNFFYQIDNGTWVLRYHYERANGNFNWWSPSTSWVCGSEKNFYKPNLFPKQNVNFYDGNNVLYRTHYLANAATSSMYCYTPHAYNNPSGLYGLPAYGTTGSYYSGSYNFVSSYENWFGTTHGNLVMTEGGGVYLIENGVKRAFPSELIFLSYSYSWEGVEIMGESALNSIPDGPPMKHFREGQLVSPNNDGVYLVENATKRAFPSALIFLSNSYKWSDIRAITGSELDLIPDGLPMTYKRNGQLISSSSGGVYLIENATKRAMPSELVFLSHFYKWSMIKNVTEEEIKLTPNGMSMSYNTNYRNGRLVKYSSTGGVYLIENGFKRPFPSASVFLYYSYGWLDTITISQTELSSIPNGEPMGYDQLKSTPTGGVYLIENGFKRPFPNEITFISNGYKWSSVKKASSDELSLIPNGTVVNYNTHYRNGLPVTSFSNGVYLVENGFKRPFPNAETFISYSYKWTDVLTLSTTELSLIPSGTEIK